MEDVAIGELRERSAHALHRIGQGACHATPPRHAAFSVAPVLPSGTSLAAFNLSVDNVRLIVVRPPADTVFDQTVAFPANQSSLPISADIPLEQSPETFQVTIQLLSGTTLLFAGTQCVSVTADQVTPPAQIPVTYSGPAAERRDCGRGIPAKARRQSRDASRS